MAWVDINIKQLPITTYSARCRPAVFYRVTLDALVPYWFTSIISVLEMSSRKPVSFMSTCHIQYNISDNQSHNSTLSKTYITKLMNIVEECFRRERSIDKTNIKKKYLKNLTTSSRNIHSHEKNSQDQFTNTTYFL